MTMISDLQRDLIEEILSRVPLKFMREVRLTCRTWNNLSKNQSFSKMQINKEEAAMEEGESQVIVLIDKSLYLMSVVVNEDPYIKTKGKLTCLTNVTEQAKVYQVLNCEGLMLCIFEDDNEYENTNLMVWNPYCLQPKWFKPRCSYNRLVGLLYLCRYGVGYVENKSCGRSHKILRFRDVRFLNVIAKENFYSYEIYDIKSESWRTLDITPLWSISFHDLGITVNGNTYWCVTAFQRYHIICFDFTKESFGPLMLVPFSATAQTVTLSCVREKKLAALVQHHMPNLHDFEIWITTAIEPEKMTWSKFFAVNLGPETGSTLRLQSFIIDEEKKLVIGFDQAWGKTSYDKIIIIGECGYFRTLDLFEGPDNIYHKRHLCGYYVPSLEQASCKRQKEETRQ